MIKFTLKELEDLDTAIFILYMTERVENKSENPNKIKSFLNCTDRVVSTAFLFIVISRLTNKHPQSLYPQLLKINLK